MGPLPLERGQERLQLRPRCSVENLDERDGRDVGRRRSRCPTLAGGWSNVVVADIATTQPRRALLVETGQGCSHRLHPARALLDGLLQSSRRLGAVIDLGHDRGRRAFSFELEAPHVPSPHADVGCVLGPRGGAQDRETATGATSPVVIPPPTLPPHAKRRRL